MGGLLGFIFGLAFFPAVISLVFLHAYLTFPIRDDTAQREYDVDSIVQPGDDVEAIKRAQKTLGEKFQSRNNEDSNFAGYFAVTREFTPGGVNSKPLERNTPVGSTTVTAPSPSVYQTMYRSIFDRKPSNSPLDNKGVGKPQRRGGNVFYVVLRHGHLMLFDDDEQIEVRHVISLQHHAISIYSGGDETPEGELFIKRNAICLSRRSDVGEITADGRMSKPFFLFSDSCSEKEDFYFALLRNQERRPDAKYNPPIPLQYEVKDIITLVQRLHSSEEHLQTRWINALIGRVFLALYKTPEVENFVRAKMTKKISRVKTPSFLSKISLREIYMGEAAPVITNPRLKDLTVDGELVVEADMRYAGNARLEVAATARIELGSRFKAREVDLLLAVVLKRLEGHIMIRIKPPPSNRLWVTFSTMPKIDMTVEPIVSSRQITYNLILRQIENRIKEVVAESLVYPNWDDSPFYHSENKAWRGGIWADTNDIRTAPEHENSAAENGDVDGVGALEGESEEGIADLLRVEKSISTPMVDASPPSTLFSRKGAKSEVNLSHSKYSGSSSSIDARSTMSEKPTEKPRALRSSSFVSAAPPITSTDATNADAFRQSNTPPEHSHAMAAITALSQSVSPPQSPVGSPSRLSRMEKTGSQSSTSSHGSSHSEKDHRQELTPQPTISVSGLNNNSNSSSHPSSPASLSNASFYSEAPSARSFGSFSHYGRRDSSFSMSTSNTTPEPKRLSLAAVTNAAATAKKWGLNALQRHAEGKPGSMAEEGPSRPLVMGRGQPLPPPGVPLPFPDKKTKTAPIPVPKRKPIAPPNMPQKPKSNNSEGESNGYSIHRHPVPPPPLPKRRSNSEAPGYSGSTSTDDGLFVVAAPAGDSEPTTPLSEHPTTYLPPWVDDADENEEEHAKPVLAPKEPPRLPRRRPPHRAFSTSPEEDGHNLPSWMAAQEEEARAKSAYVDEDSGV